MLRIAGVLLMDEMKLASSLKFQKDDLQIIGFVDLGKYTPETQKNEMGDHALVLMYQPFRGKYIQTVAAFLSRGAATATVLVQILMEAVILLENSGFYVDGVVTDGAQWNRGMWAQFGVDKEEISCEHFVDEERRFFFFSDFPHMVKTLWTWTLSHSVLNVITCILQLVMATLLYKQFIPLLFVDDHCTDARWDSQRKGLGDSDRFGGTTCAKSMS